MDSPPQRPARVGGQRHGHVGQPYAGDIVAVAVGLRNEARIDRAVARIVLVRRRREREHRRIDRRDPGLVEVPPVVEVIARGLETGVGDAGNIREAHPGLRQRRHQRTVTQLRHPAARRLAVFRRPLVQGDEQRALHRRRIQRIVGLLAEPPARGGAGGIPPGVAAVPCRMLDMK